MTRPLSEEAVQRHRDRLDIVVTVVTAVDPSLPPALVAEAVERVAAAVQTRARLAAYLSEHPESLTAGHSRPPKVVGALIAALVEHGSFVLVVPRCAGCNRAVELFHTRGPDARICAACWKRDHVAECADCGRLQPIAKRTASGAAQCAMCHKRAHLENCGECGRLKQVAGRSEDGTASCSGCRRRDQTTWRTCSGCGRDRPVNVRDADGGPLCAVCYDQPPDSCTECGEMTTIASRLDDKPVCARCYRHPERRCGGCDRVRRVAVRGRNGQSDLCPTCHQAPVLTCGVCGARARCRTTTPDRSPICWRCQLVRRLDEVLGDADGNILGPLLPLREAILAVGNPRTAMGWLGRSPAIEVLTAVAHGDLPLTHSTLDAAAGPRRGRAFAIEHLRQLLVTSGALPERDRHLARLEAALEDLLAAAHPEDRQLLRTYATWRLLNRLRRNADQRRSNPGAAYRVHDMTAEAARFLDWLRARDTPLNACTQADLDTWLNLRARGRRVHLATFLDWARQRRVIRALDVPRSRSGGSVRFVADEHRWNLARRALTDDTLQVRDRVAALLLLLYGQPASRIIRLTRADLHLGQGEVHLRLGADPIVLPPPLDELIQQLPEEGPVGMAGNLVNGDPWLFPGRRPGQPLHATSLGHRLRALGIEPRAARNTALLQLGAELPSVVLSDLLGICINTAEKWNAAAGARWTNYAAARLSGNP